MPYLGAIDTPQSDTVSGWAVDTDGGACDVTVVVNGGEPITVPSNQARPDLVESSLSKGQGGFRVDIAKALEGGDNLIELRFPDGTHLPGSPIRRTIEPTPGAEPRSFRGYIENTQSDIIFGWAVLDDGLPCVVTVEINGTQTFMARADRSRPDLVKSGISQGLGGLRIDVSSYLRPGSNEIAVLFPNGAHLSGSPVTRVVPGGEAESSRSAVAEAPPPKAAALAARAKPGQEKKTTSARKTAVVTKKPALPSLAELDELSLDDISLAIASGMISVPEPAIQAPLLEETKSAEPISDGPAPNTPRRSGWLGRLFRRN